MTTNPETRMFELIDIITLLVRKQSLGLVDKPKGWLTKKCPICNCVLKKTSFSTTERYGFSRYYYYNCDNKTHSQYEFGRHDYSLA